MTKYLLFIFILFSAQTLFSQETKYVNTELLNVRSGPGKNYEVLDTAPKGEKITELSKEGNWTKIHMDSGITGFVSTKFLTAAQPSSAKTNNKSYSWWQIILAIGGFLLLAKFFGGKKNASPLSNPQPATVTPPSNPKSSFTLRAPESVFVCKFCGTERRSLSNLTRDSCRHSPNGHHQPFEGIPRNKYYCKFCGSERRSISNLTRDSCRSSPNGQHQPYEGVESQKYSCKFCGTERRSLANLTRDSCKTSPNGHHQPLT